MKRDLWKARHNCTDCGCLMKRRMMKVEGTSIRGWECPECKETVLHPGDAQRMLVLNKLRKGLPVKIGELGKSLIVRIPKEIAQLYNLAKGEEVLMKAENEAKIELAI